MVIVRPYSRYLSSCHPHYVVAGDTLEGTPRARRTLAFEASDVLQLRLNEFEVALQTFCSGGSSL